MYLSLNRTCDVLVLGSGIAGISAAIEAAETGCSVVLACKGKLFSGSSFYPGTWGLGLIGPTDASDEEDLMQSIQQVGCNVADSKMVEAFVHGITPSIEKVRSMGIKLRRPNCETQREYIPCFDHKHRDWNGIEFDSAREVYAQRLNELGVTVLPNCEALELVCQNGHVCGAVLAMDQRLEYLGSKTVVLATGGYGSLFAYHLCTEDVEGLGQSLALDMGCTLVNMEFMQMMPGYITPAYKTIFNEKVFRFTELRTQEGKELLAPEQLTLLEERSTHGPFTSRLASRGVDLAICQACKDNPNGVFASYSAELRRETPEFVKAYFDWLYETRGLTTEDTIQIAIFAHAANGGIRIDENAFTGVSGLFACGEVTGGMHGADRIGGLSTANGLVFGRKAGQSAAAIAPRLPEPPKSWEFRAYEVADRQTVLSQLQNIMAQHAMVVRTEDGLQSALNQVQVLSKNLIPIDSENVKAIAQSRRLLGRLQTAQAILQSALLRKESRGSHYRLDYPEQDSAQSRPIFVTLKSGNVLAYYSNEVEPWA